MVMKKILLIAFLFASFVSFGQPGYTDINSGYRWLRGNFRALHVPSGTSFGLQSGQWPGAGALYLDTAGADSGFYYRGVNASWHRLPKATETFYLGDGTFSSNRTVTGGGFSLTFSGLSTFTLGSTGAQSFNANGGVGVRSDIYLRPDSILIEPHDGKITIDSLRSGHPTDTTTYKPMVWSPTNKSWRYLTGWPGTGGSSGITVGTTTITSGTDGRFAYNNGGVYGETNGMFWDDANARLGLGATTVPIKFTVRGTAGIESAILQQNTTDNVEFVFYPASIGVVFGILDGKDHIFASYSSPQGLSGFSERGRWNTSGELIVGTTDNGTHKFQVNGTSYFSGEPQFETQLKLKDISAPSTPASGYGSNYVNTDKPWFKDDGGNAFEYSLFAVSTTASSATPTPTGHARTNDLDVTALATNPTFAAPSGTPINGNRLVIRIKDDGTPRTLAFNAIYRAGAIALPTTTTTSKTLYLGFIYNSADSKWDLVSSVDQF
jgi:hypothetical protein